MITGPLSTLPPFPALSQLGGAQPRSQWQFLLLLHIYNRKHAELINSPVIMTSSVFLIWHAASHHLVLILLNIVEPLLK